MESSVSSSHTPSRRTIIACFLLYRPYRAEHEHYRA